MDGDQYHNIIMTKEYQSLTPELRPPPDNTIIIINITHWPNLNNTFVQNTKYATARDLLSLTNIYVTADQSNSVSLASPTCLTIN